MKGVGLVYKMKEEIWDWSGVEWSVIRLDGSWERVEEPPTPTPTHKHS